MTDNVIPVFFASDENYAPLLSVSVGSMLDCVSPDRFISVHILASGLTGETRRRLAELATPNSEIIFEDASELVADISDRLCLRDYYSAATYYRLFIADMFPQYDKALYFDADLLFRGDIAQLYDIPLGDNLIGAVREDVMSMEPVFGGYVEHVLGVPRGRYINAGVLLMNLDGFRRERILNRFINMLPVCRYQVTQDQDYLNVLCDGRVLLLGDGWNKSPCNAVSGRIKNPAIIHFKLNWRPWQQNGVKYGRLFWEAARKYGFEPELKAKKAAFGAAGRIRARIQYEKLMALAVDCTLEEEQAEDDYYEFGGLGEDYGFAYTIKA